MSGWRWFFFVGPDTPTRRIVASATVRAMIAGAVFGLGVLALGNPRPLLQGIGFGVVMGTLFLVQGMRLRAKSRIARDRRTAAG